MVICADTSFLFSLYGDDDHTDRAVSWMKKQKTPLTLSSLNEYELGNALRFAEFRKSIAKGAAALYWAHFETDKASDRLIVRVCNLAEVIDEAKRLSATHTLTQGHRGFDILHMASALHMQATHFLTFDTNQKKLAETEGLIVPF
jgi:predicted nucleic acid-binding protein